MLEVLLVHQRGTVLSGPSGVLLSVKPLLHRLLDLKPTEIRNVPAEKHETLLQLKAVTQLGVV